MKLAYSPASPYVRKVNACAIARGIDKQIERWKVGTTDPALLEFNPLSKVPTLITDDGARLYDSPVICEYLDSVGSAPKLFPAPARRAGRRSPASAGRRHFGRHPAAPARDRADSGRWPQVLHRAAEGQGDAGARGAREGGGLAGHLKTIGEITIGCALGYLDFRYANEPWRPGHPKLEAWYAKVGEAPPLAETMPVG